MRCLAFLAAVAVVALGARAAGATPTSKLVYSRSGDATSCPDEQALRRAVAARVGYDPFFAWATRTIVASVTRREQAFVATVDLVDEQGLSHGARELTTGGECGELLDAVALAIAIAIDPQSLSRPSTPPPPAPEPAPPPRTESAAPPPSRPDTQDFVPPPPRAAAPSPFAVELSAGAVVSGGVAPGPAAGLSLGAGLRWRALSLSLEGRIDAPAGSSAPGGGDVSSWLVLGSLVPCAHLGAVFACALGQGGSMQTSGSGVPDTTSTSVPWWAVGGRVGALFRLTDAASLRVRTDVVANVDRATLLLNGEGAWTAPAVAASLAADVVLHFR